MRYFRATADAYGVICSQLDAAYGYPNESTKTQRSLPPAESLPSDSSGRVYLAIQVWFCEYILPKQMLPELIAAGTIEEITHEQYKSILPPAQPLP
jgi:hypothetical protein